MTKKKINPHVGNNFDRFLEEEGILHEVEIVAAKRVIAWQIADIMETERISKTAMASRMGTSRAVLDRLLERVSRRLGDHEIIIAGWIIPAS